MHDDEMVAIAQILKPHGLAGEVRVLPLTNFPEHFAKLEKVYLQINNSEGQTVHVVSAKPHQKGLWLMKFSEFTSIEMVEHLRHAYVKISHDALFTLPTGHYYVMDLIGCTVYLEDKSKIGVITNVLQTGANDVYVVRTATKDVLIPAIKECIQTIDIDNKTIIIRLLAGLLD